MKKLPTVHIALPVLNESENLPLFLKCVREQDYGGKICLFVCVNQPEAWWNLSGKQHICHDNALSLEMLRNKAGIDITLIDRSSKGQGWIGRQHGVGFARKEVMDALVQQADQNDIIISLDADTGFNPGYVSSVVDSIRSNKSCVALAVPYYHKLSGNEMADRAILRYEIYMRCYAINLMRIDSPYAFTALGSAIALTVGNYRSIGGITPKMSGEDFYFLQKLRKKGKILTWNKEKVYPAARFSDRVYFGTGPAMIKGAVGDWSSYPMYHHAWFDDIAKTYTSFADLYEKNLPTSMDKFLTEIFPGEPVWNKLRKNSGSVDKFVWACHQKIDGLRLLQYLKWRHRQTPVSDEASLMEFINAFYPDSKLFQELKTAELSFSSSPIALLNQIRDFLVEKEEAGKTNIQKKSWQ